ncbi:MAG: WD40/YVTN/BNR-like repeat-containing protein [Hyalangium sp.]|uniref:WD40/YVTN/BNR-like repeat-containing protein n=1 Tax=Hyalangium sp. TaxID=2028555 RepID=UPI00389A3314
MRSTPKWSVLAAALAMATCTDKTSNLDVDRDEVERDGSRLAGGLHLGAGDESAKVYKAALARFEARAAPATTVPAAAWPAAVAYTRGVKGSSSAAWSELGPKNYNSDNPLYADPYFSNTGGGAGMNSGRITALAALEDGQTVFAGGAGGGLWKSTDGGVHWTPVGDSLESLSIGALAIDEQPGGYTVYAGTGEANTNSDAFAGVGVLRSTDGGKTWARMGGDELLGAFVGRIIVDSVDHTRLYAATSHGVYRWTAGATAWQRILGSGTSPVANIVTDLVVKPGTGGTTGDLVAVIGWRNGADTNGIFESQDGGNTWTGPFNPQGYVAPIAQGRVSLAYSADGGKLYAVVQDPSSMDNLSASTVLQGVYVSNTGDAHGPFNKIASASKLQGDSDSAMKTGSMGHAYQPGIQAWYNQFLVVDPADANHLYLGLEEVYESTNGGTSWETLGAYWNFTLSCFAYNPLGGTCVATTHSDQHAAFIAHGTLWVGNDGGVWSRSLANHAPGGWSNLNATLGTLQFYYAGAGKTATGPLTYYGGLQDNGTAKVVVGQEPAEPFGGDGGDVVVDPTNPDNVMTEYTNLDVAKSRDGGKTWTDIAPRDPSARFIAPFMMDPNNKNHLVAGGQYVWESTKGFDTLCDSNGCDWKVSYDLGSGRAATAVGASGSTVFASWCGPCSPSLITGTGFKNGIATNYGGTWHQVTSPLGTRYISAVTVDPANAAHVYVTYSGYSRRWLVGPDDPGVGHVFESNNGGATWTDITGDLVDVAANDVVITSRGLAVATDVGVFSSGLHGGTWKRAGTGLPLVSVSDLSVAPGDILIAATYGRGLWTLPVSAL